MVAINRASCPLAMVSVLLTWSGGVISSDSILSQIPYTGQCARTSILPCSIKFVYIIHAGSSYDNKHGFTYRQYSRHLQALVINSEPLNFAPVSQKQMHPI